PWDTEAELKEWRRLDQSVRNQFLCEADVAELEDFELGFHAQLTDARRHLLEMRGRVHEYARAEIHGAAVEAAEPGPQRLDVLEPHERRHEIGTRTPTRRV